MNRWILMCPDLRAAALNRKRQWENLNWWYWYEAVIKSYPRNKPLPEWIPIGQLPRVGKSENIYQYGIVEIGDDGIIHE